MSGDQELDGNTLRIYIALANADKPIGPREITRILNLSSPSVAYRNLQKLEELKFIEKKEFGYIVKQKRKVKGHLWLGSRLLPRQLFYAFFFIGILSIEVIIVVLRLLNDTKFSYDFILLVIITAVSTLLFLAEWGLSLEIQAK